MSWYSSKQSNIDKKQSEEATHKSAIEVKVHKKATKKSVDDTKKAIEQLNKTLLRNNFTLKIYIAVGGKHK